MDVVLPKHSNFSCFDNGSYTHQVSTDTVSEETNEALVEQLNKEFQETVLPVTVFVGLEAFLGLFGNLLVLFVFSKHYHVCNFRYFVICLAIIDLTSSLTTVPGEIVTQMYWYMYPQRELCKIKSFFNMFTASAEAMCLLTIAFDRYRKVCSPLSWQIRPRIAIYVCAAIFVVAAILAVPVPIFWGTHSHSTVYKGVEINVTVCEKDEQFENTKYPFIYSVTAQVIVSISLVLMLVLYVIVAKELFKEKHNKQTDHSTPPVIVVTPATASETDFSCNENNVYLRTDISDTGISSGLEIKGKHKHDHKHKVGTITSDDETDSKEFGATLQVPKHGPKMTRCKPSSSSQKISRKMNVTNRVRRKTLIMFILTLAFIATTVLYLTLLSFIARSDDTLQNMSNGGKAAYFFFFRLYFINHVINPIIYGLLDPRFKKALRNARKSLFIK